MKEISRSHFDSVVVASSAAEPGKEVAVATVCTSPRFAERKLKVLVFSTELLHSLKLLGHEEHMQHGLAQLFPPLIILCAN